MLDEFLARNGQDLASGDTKRALLLNDVWAAFDLAAAYHQTSPASRTLQGRLAAVIGRLRMKDAALAGLPDNYADAVKSGAFARDFDPQSPRAAFLPPDLFDASGPWVEVGDDESGLVAPSHVQKVAGRSSFRIFIRCPGGREATFAYLRKLNFHATPWLIGPAAIGTRYPSGESVRMDPPLRPDPATPQFPAGTIVALVKQMAAINRADEPVPTPITQKVQFRVYTRIEGIGERPLERFRASQVAHEIVMRRQALVAGEAGGLRGVAPDEREFRQDWLEPTRERLLRGPVVLETCVRCHGGRDGILSVSSYTGFLAGPGGMFRANPRLLPARDADYQRHAAKESKKQRADWGLLRGLLQAEEQAGQQRR